MIAKKCEVHLANMFELVSFGFIIILENDYKI